jgi:DNA-binding SARP family transcriptional activator
MELRVLGPIEVRHDGSPVLLRGGKPRQLLSLLAMRANRPVPADQLIEELWEGDPPPSASIALRVHVNRLRQVLELDRSAHAPSARLPAGPHGYQLRVEPDELDAQRFERLVAFARDANANGEPAMAVRQLTEAIDLWRGHAYADARDLSAARAEIARLEDHRAVAFEELAEARLARGEHSLVVDVLAEAVREFPLRERLTGQLMHALYQSGRQADALRAFTEIAGRLDRQLGVVPSPDLRRLEEDILLQRPSLGDDRYRAAKATAAHRRSPTIRVVGRRAELGRLMDLSAAAAAGECRTALVSGEAGIGKTTLVEEFSSRAAVGADVFIGRCTQDQPDGYQGVADIVRTIVDGLDDEERAALPAELCIVVPELAASRADAPAVDGDPQSARLRLHQEVASLFDRHAGHPRVVVIEDAHWANRATLTLLRHLLRRPAAGGFLVVVTFRDDEISADRAERIESLVPPIQSEHMRLAAFDDSEVRAVVRVTAAPESLPRLLELSGTIREVTGGNPLFVRELLRDLDDDATKLDERIERTLSSVAPAGVRAIIDGRVERLTQTAARIVQAMSVLGDGISTPILARVCELGPQELLDGLEECLASRLLIEDTEQMDRFSFPHALVRAAIYPIIDPEERAALHARAAAVLETIPATSAAELAFHSCEGAAAVTHEKATVDAERAGHEAFRAYAFGQAAEWFDRAIDHRVRAGAQPATLGRLELALGRALAQDGQFRRADAVFATAADAARATTDRELLSEVALEVAGPWSSGFDQPTFALELIEAALADRDTLPPSTCVQLLNAQATMLYYVDPEREGRAARDASEIAQVVADKTAQAISCLALHRWYTHEPAARSERLALARRALGFSTPDPAGGALHLRIHRELLADLLENARIEEFTHGLDLYERTAAALTSPRDIYWATALRATEHTLHGDLAAAEQQARGAALRGSELDQRASGALVLHNFVIRFQQDRLREDLPAMRAATKMSSAYRSGPAMAAFACAETDNFDEVAPFARQALGDDGALVPRDVFWLGTVALLAGAVARAGTDAELVALLDDLLGPCAEHVVVFGTGGAVLGTGHHWIGQLALARADPRRALEHLVRAVELSEALAAPYWAAQARLDAARAHERLGSVADLREAVALRRRVTAVAEPQGYARLCRPPS